MTKFQAYAKDSGGIARKGISDPVVSVVIPCFNHGALLPRALHSLSGQGVPVEAIVVDDGSTDPVQLDTSGFDFPVRLLRQTNRGPAAARNTGLAASCGLYVKFLDADDNLLRDCLSSQVNSIRPDGSTVSVIGFRLDYEDGGASQDILPAFGNFLQALLLTNLGPPSIYLFPKQLLLQAGGFHEGARTSGGHEDYDLPLRLAAAGTGAVTVHRIGTVYRKREGSVSDNRVAMARSRLDVWCHHLPGILANADAGTVMAALTAWWRLYEQTPDSLRTRLLTSVASLVQAVRHSASSLPADEVSKLLVATESQTPAACGELFEALHAAISNRSPVLRGAALHPLEMIDRRLSIPYAEWLLERLPVIISQLHSASPAAYAIYGAGEFGRRLGRLLSAAGLPPQCYVDREADAMGGQLDQVPVVTLDQTLGMGLRCFVIASLHHRDAIQHELSQRFDDTLRIIPG